MKRIYSLLVVVVLLSLTPFWQGCGCNSAKAATDTTAIAPSLKVELESFEVVKKQVGYLKPEPFLDFLGRGGDSAVTKSGFSLFLADPVSFFHSFGLLPVLLCVLAGGLVLNLTPCVLPMIPINLAILGVGGGGGRSRGFGLGTAYGLGITAVYGLLGGAAVLTGALFGAIQSTWWFNFGVAALFIILGLAMFDIIHIDLTSFQGKATSGEKERNAYTTAMALGAVSALLAGACVAPVVIAVLLLAATMGTAGLLLPFLLGLGMALPWPLAAGGVGILPKPGKWMVSIKYGFGCIIFLFALNYGFLGYRAIFPDNSAQASASHIGVFPLVRGGDQQELVRLLQQGREAQRPVLLDFRADWCKNCRAMEQSTFTHPVIAARLAQYQPIAIDCNNLKDPQTRKIMDYFGVQGLPTLVLLRSK